MAADAGESVDALSGHFALYQLKDGHRFSTDDLLTAWYGIALFGMMRALDLPEWFRHQTWEEPPLVIRSRDGAVHPEYAVVKLAIGFPP